MFHGRSKVPPGRIIEVWKCDSARRRECLELALDKLRIDTKERREKEREEWKRRK